MKYEKSLQELGLTKEEARVYLACIRSSMAKPSELAEITTYPRTSIYIYADNLVKKGFLRKTKRNKVVYYIPVDPSHVIQKAEERVKKVSKIVDQLESLYDFLGQKPHVEYFDTKDGLSKVYESMLNYKHKDYPPLLIEDTRATRENVEKMGYDFWTDWEDKIVEREIITKGVGPESLLIELKKAPKRLIDSLNKRTYSVRLLPDEKIPFKFNVYLFYPEIVYFVVPQDNFVVKIDSKIIYKTFESIFEGLYAQGREFKKEELE